MKGLEDYVKKHSCHFTEELAEKAIERFDKPIAPSKVQASLDRKVYYNTIGATSGDIVYIANLAHSEASDGKYIERTIEILQGIQNYKEIAFTSWVTGMIYEGSEFDFTPYI